MQYRSIIRIRPKIIITEKMTDQQRHELMTGMKVINIVNKVTNMKKTKRTMKF